jgi:hypothetical protein
MKVLFAICFGLTQMTDAVGVFHQEVQDTLLDKTFPNNLTTQMI